MPNNRSDQQIPDLKDGSVQIGGMEYVTAREGRRRTGLATGRIHSFRKEICVGLGRQIRAKRQWFRERFRPIQVWVYDWSDLEKAAKAWRNPEDFEEGQFQWPTAREIAIQYGRGEDQVYRHARRGNIRTGKKRHVAVGAWQGKVSTFSPTDAELTFGEIINDDEWPTFKEAAEEIGCKPNTLSKWVELGWCPRLGRPIVWKWSRRQRKRLRTLNPRDLALLKDPPVSDTKDSAWCGERDAESEYGFDRRRLNQCANKGSKLYGVRIRNRRVKQRPERKARQGHKPKMIRQYLRADLETAVRNRDGIGNDPNWLPIRRHSNEVGFHISRLAQICRDGSWCGIPTRAEMRLARCQDGFRVRECWHIHRDDFEMIKRALNGSEGDAAQTTGNGAPPASNVSQPCNLETRQTKQWYFDCPPPPESPFQFGPLRGTLKDLGEAIDRAPRTLKRNNGGPWYIEKLGRFDYAVWFRNKRRYDAAAKKLGVPVDE